MQFFKKIVRNCVMGNFTIPHLIPLLTRNIDHCLVFVLEQSNHRDTPQMSPVSLILHIKSTVNSCPQLLLYRLSCFQERPYYSYLVSLLGSSVTQIYTSIIIIHSFNACLEKTKHFPATDSIGKIARAMMIIACLTRLVERKMYIHSLIMGNTEPFKFLNYSLIIIWKYVSFFFIFRNLDWKTINESHIFNSI